MLVLCMKSRVHCCTKVASNEHVNARARAKNQKKLQAREDMAGLKSEGVHGAIVVPFAEADSCKEICVSNATVVFAGSC